MTKPDTKQNSAEVKSKSWSMTREVAQFISIILGIILSLIALLSKVGTANDGIDNLNKEIVKQNKQIQDIREALIDKHIIKPGSK